MSGSAPLQGVLQEALESHRSIAEPKGHMSKLIKPQIAHDEGSVLLRPWCHLDLPKSTFEIHHAEMCSTHHTLQCLLDLGQRVGILLCACIESVEIHAVAQQTIFFSYQYHCIAPWRLAGHIAPASSISQSEACTSSKSSGGIRLNCSLKGSLSVMQISCLTTLVQPSSFPSSAKISWKARTRS